MVDSTFITDVSKFLSGSLIALSAMVHLELPHINVLTKSDLVSKTSQSDVSSTRGGDADDATDPFASFLSPSAKELSSTLTNETGPRYRRLNNALAEILDEFSLVGYVPMSIKDSDSISIVMAHLDNAVQYGDDVEPRALERGGENGSMGGY